jgi:hypothetical protein
MSAASIDFAADADAFLLARGFLASAAGADFAAVAALRRC